MTREQKGPCPACGVILKQRDNETDRDFRKRIHCNEFCSHKARYIDARIRLAKLPIKQCVICGLNIEKKYNGIPATYKKQLYCSKKCATINAQNGAKKANKLRFKDKMESGTKKCAICFEDKPLDQFLLHNKKKAKHTGKIYHSSYCLNCLDDLSTEERLRKYFNITYDEYRAIAKYQNYVCAICQKTTKRKLSVDHHHKTGKIRGLVCWQCNSGLGCFRDDPERLKKALEYIITPPASIVLKEDRFGCKGSVASKANRGKKLDIDLVEYLKNKAQERLKGE